VKRTQIPPSVPLARQAREHFVGQLEGFLPALSDAIRARLIEAAGAPGSSRDAQTRRDAMLEFDRLRAAWQQAMVGAWRKAIAPPAPASRVRLQALDLELIGDDVVENKILASRLALAITDKATWALSDLKVRMQHIEDDQELGPQDVLRPESVAQLMIELWAASGLERTTWQLVQDVIQKQMTERMAAAYESTNAFLVGRGVLPEIDRSGKVKRSVVAPTRPGNVGAAGGVNADAQTTQGGASQGVSGSEDHGGSGFAGQHGPASTQSGYAGTTGGVGGSGAAGTGGAQAAGRGNGANGSTAPGGVGFGAGSGGPGSGSGLAGSGSTAPNGQGIAGAAGGGGGGGGAGNGIQLNFGTARPDAPAALPGGGGGAPGGGGNTGYGGTGFGGNTGFGGPGARATGAAAARTRAGGVADETRMMTSTTPLARARMRASGVIGQLKRLLTERAGYNPDQAVPPSPALTQAIGQHATQVQTQVQTRIDAEATLHEVVVYDDAAVERVAVDLRERTGELKRKATTQSEKATIEIVALMFQSILSEERIPPAVRVWFARLQMPVLRVALAEPEFFGTLQHPARQLIDRMGSCVLGFNAATISGSALELEIKRVVQVIEQYPETGRRVFQLVYEEFQKFLSKFLTEKGETQRLVSVAQQVEQKETMAVQYTIELRKMLNDMPVRDELREFLFKVWAEVLAVAAVRFGGQHAETVALKKAAGELVWSASAKPNRTERARVINDLPQLLQRLRKGMTLLGLPAAEQEKHIKIIGDTLADAFMSKTDVIPQAKIDAMTKRLANLEDFIADDSNADLPLDAESIELMLGIDASMIEVVADGGSQPSDAMMAWAMELQQGNWFTLDHSGKVHQVQYAWRSNRRQLHLFASVEGRSFLIQARRLAAYLQAGLLLPAEEEALTVRATRDALAKLDANPERLLAV
jgi:hypothetical protein